MEKSCSTPLWAVHAIGGFLSLGECSRLPVTSCLLCLFLRHISLTLPATFRGRNSTRADYEYQHSNLYAISGTWGPCQQPVLPLCPGTTSLSVSWLLMASVLPLSFFPCKGPGALGTRPPLSFVSLKHLEKGQILRMF